MRYQPSFEENDQEKKLMLEKLAFFQDEKELIDFRYQFKSWPQTIGGDYKMEVEIKSGTEFSWNWHDNKVSLGIGYIDQVYKLFQKKHSDLPEADLKKMTLEALYGAAIHEGLHRKYTVRPSALLAQDELKELFSNVGFASMNNAIEDPRINTTCSKHYPALFPKIQTYIEADIMEGGDLSYRHLIQEKTGWIPRFSQCGSEYMMFWAHLLKTDIVKKNLVERERINEELEVFIKEKSYSIDEKVQEVLRKTAYDMVRSFMAIPDQETIFAMSKQSMDINKEVIWPIFKELVEQDQKKMEQNEIVNTMLQDVLDAMGEDMAQQFLQALPHQEKGQIPMDSEQLAPEIQQKLEEFRNQLPPKKRADLKQKAKETLEDIEDMINSTLKPQGSPDLIPSHREQKKAEQAVQQAKEQKEKYDQQRKELDQIMKEMKEKIDQEINKKSPYEQDFDWLKNNIDFTKERDKFRKLFMPNYTIKSTLAETGSQGVDLLAAMQRKAAKKMGDPGISHAIWRNLEKPHQTSYAFTFVVDLSGSMRGENIENTLKAITFLNEIFADSYLSQVEIEILGFHTMPKNEEQRESFVFRSARDKGHLEKVNQKIATMLQEVKSSGASHNDDGVAIRWATSRLMKSPQKKKFLIVFSDGEPAYSSTYRNVDQERDTRAAISEASKNIGRDPFCFFLGDSGKPEDYYNLEGRQNVLRENNPKHFIEQLSELISVMIMHPNDYLRYLDKGTIDQARAANDFHKAKGSQ